MEEFLENERRLVNCYRAYSGNKNQAAEKCQQYADQMSELLESGQMNFGETAKSLWANYYKTKQFYDSNK